jgi:hypothetical protein
MGYMMLEEQYNDLVDRIGWLAMRAKSPGEFVRSAVDSLAEGFEAIRVSMTIRTTPGGPVAFHEAHFQAASRSRPRFVFSRKIVASGVEYGQLEVESSQPVRSAVQTLETVARLAGSYAQPLSVQRRIAI